MGTNFYAIQPLSKKKREKINNIISEFLSKLTENSSDTNNLWNLYKERVDNEIQEPIHLGKRSAGWQFLWDYHNGRYYTSTLEGIKNFLKDKVIIDEYDNKYTLDEFLDDQIGYCLYNKDGNLEDGINGMYNYYSSEYFNNDGLRFAKFEDFS